jgi:hypothetical protein
MDVDRPRRPGRVRCRRMASAMRVGAGGARCDGARPRRPARAPAATRSESSRRSVSRRASPNRCSRSAGRLANRGRLAEVGSVGALAGVRRRRRGCARARRTGGWAACGPPRRSTRDSEPRYGWRRKSLIALRESGRELAAPTSAASTADPARQEAVERRMAAIEDLARKHHVDATALPEKLEELAARTRNPRAVGAGAWATRRAHRSSSSTLCRRGVRSLTPHAAQRRASSPPRLPPSCGS